MALHELGQKIRAAREENGMAIEDVAQKIKLSVTILKAIEEGDNSALPHAVYTKGFTRSYAASVGLNPEEIKELLEKAFAAEIAEDAQPEASSLTQKYQQQNSSKNMAFYAILLLIFAMIGGIFWYVGSSYGEAILTAIKKPFSSSEQESATNSEPSIHLEAQQEQSLVPEAQEQLPPPETESEVTAEQIQPVDTPLVEATSEDTESHIPLLVSPASTGTHEVDIVANEECYLRIQRETAGPVHYTLKPGEQYKVRFDKRLNILFGNAGGVTVKYDNKDMGVIGEKWQKREVSFPPAR